MKGLIHEVLLVTAWLVPLCCAAMTMAHAKGIKCSIAILAPLPAVLLTGLSLLTKTDYHLELPWLLLGSQLGVDAVGRIFLLLTSVLWFCASLYAAGYLQHESEQKQRRFFTFFFLAMAGNIGLVLAQDLATFFFFFALMSFAAYGLIVHDGSRAAITAAKVTIALVVISETALWSALVIIARYSDSLQFGQLALAATGDIPSPVVLSLLLLGLGIKAGLLGLHVWLPPAHSVAPTPASAVLSGAMIKAGLLGWLRLLPLGEIALVDLGETLLTIGFLTAFLAALTGCTQSNPKTTLAYSSISQMGLMVALIGLGLIMPAAWPLLLSVLLVYALHHGLVKGALFLGVGIYRQRLGFAGLRIALLLWLALALAGGPLTSGMLVKLAFKHSLTALPATYALLPLLLTLSSITTGLLMLRYLFLLLQEPAEQAHPLPTVYRHAMIMAWLLCSASIFGVWALTDIASFWSLSAMGSALWPVLIALAAGLSVITLWYTKKFSLLQAIPCLRIPAGDLLIPMQAVLRAIFTTTNTICLQVLPAYRQRLRVWLRLIQRR